MVGDRILAAARGVAGDRGQSVFGAEGVYLLRAVEERVADHEMVDELMAALVVPRVSFAFRQTRGKVPQPARVTFVGVLLAGGAEFGSGRTEQDLGGGGFLFVVEVSGWCAQNEQVSELTTLAATISRWEDQIVTAVITGVTNATSESLNRLQNSRPGSHAGSGTR